MNYPVGDFLIQIKNASLARKQEVAVKSTKYIFAVAEVLESMGYLDEVKKDDGETVVRLTYHRKKPLISRVRLVSKPGLRIYASVDDLEKEKGPSEFIISTPKGVMSSREAIKKRLGGEVVAEIF